MIKSHFFDAIRILFILQAGGQPIEGDEIYCSVFKGEKKLMAFDFWVRYPDYLWHELIERHKETDDNYYKEQADSILRNAEPDLRKIPMVRYLFGAYEKPDDALAILKSRELIEVKKIKLPNGYHETDFLISHKGNDLCTKAISDWPILKWYPDRAKLVSSVAGSRSGTELKDRQYKHREYAQTKQGQLIPPLATHQGAKPELTVRLE